MGTRGSSSRLLLPPWSRRHRRTQPPGPCPVFLVHLDRPHPSLSLSPFVLLLLSLSRSQFLSLSLGTGVTGARPAATATVPCRRAPPSPPSHRIHPSPMHAPPSCSDPANSEPSRRSSSSYPHRSRAMFPYVSLDLELFPNAVPGLHLSSPPRTCAAASFSSSCRHLVRRIRCLSAPSPPGASSPAPAPRSGHPRRQTPRPCSSTPLLLPVEQAEEDDASFSAVDRASIVSASLPRIMDWLPRPSPRPSPAPLLPQPSGSYTDRAKSPCSGNVEIVRIRSTTSVCLLHGLVLLPCDIPVAGADDTSAGDATELKWEFGEELGRYYVSFPVDQ